MSALVACIWAGYAQANPLQWSGNGHWYEIVRLEDAISWDEARVLAENRTYLGLRGYLATLTSYEEDTFVHQLLNDTGGGEAWAGGYQDPGVVPADYGWKWVTGEPWDYTNWAPGEPNDALGPASQQWLVVGFYDGWHWDDNEQESPRDIYIVEYVPEPTSFAVAGLGLTIMLILRRQKRRQNSQP